MGRSSVTLLRCFGSAWPDAIIEVTAPSSDVVPASSDRSGVNTPETSTEERLIPGDLIATLAARAPAPACPLTGVMEDQMSTALAGMLSGYQVRWVFSPAWSPKQITEDGRAQLAAIGFRL